jgi:hypothetical protein
MNEGILDYVLNSDNISNEEVQTCLESIESDLKELDSIDKSLESYEKASFESTIENINLLSNILAYRNIKSGIALESVSSEYGISTEGIKEIAEKGLDGLKAIGKNIISLIKSFISLFRSNKKNVNDLEKEVKSSDESYKYDLYDFTFLLYMGLVFGELFQNKSQIINENNFDPVFKNVILDATSIADHYKPDDDYVELIMDMLEFKINPNALEDYTNRAKDAATNISKNVPENFDYKKNAIHLIEIYKRMDLESRLNKIIKTVEKALKDAEERIGNSKELDKIETIQLIKLAYTMILHIKSTYHKMVRLLVLVCRKYKADYKTKDKND